MRLEQVSDVNLLRQAATLLEHENKRLVAKLAELQQELLALKGGSPEQLRFQLEQLQAALALRTKKIFGDSSEKRPSEKPARDKAAQTGHGPTEQPELRIVEETHELDEADKCCKACGGALEEWNGQFEESEEVDVIEREFVIKKHKRKKYRCACGSCIDTAMGPTKLFEGARYSIDFAIDVAIDKYADHLPLERQVRIMRRHGLETTSQTLWDQLNALYGILKPAAAQLQAYVLAQAVIGVDETHWKMMEKGGTKRWQVWAACSERAVFYRIADSRSADAAGELLQDFSGTAMCDGYGVYESLQKRSGKFHLAHCWAHARRKFVEIEENFPKPCRGILDLIGELYAVEKACPTGPPGIEMRRQLRQTKSTEIVERIRQWAFAQDALPQSGLRKAIDYMLGMWKGLVRFLDDPALALDNNATERALRGIVVGRKNHYGSKSLRGTEVAALFYSLIESAKLCALNPRAYLREATFAALRKETIQLPHEITAAA